MRLIDADALEKNLSNDLPYKGSVKRVLIQAPTVEAEPVRHGKWIFKNDGAYGKRRAYCSVCEKRSGIGGIIENQMKPYCPNCGAKMDCE